MTNCFEGVFDRVSLNARALRRILEDRSTTLQIMHRDRTREIPPTDRVIAPKNTLEASRSPLVTLNKNFYSDPQKYPQCLPGWFGTRLKMRVRFDRSRDEWAEQDSNLRRISPVGLQPTPFGRSGIRPRGGHSIDSGGRDQTSGGGLGSGVRGLGSRVLKSSIINHTSSIFPCPPLPRPNTPDPRPHPPCFPRFLWHTSPKAI